MKRAFRLFLARVKATLGLVRMIWMAEFAVVEKAVHHAQALPIERKDEGPVSWHWIQQASHVYYPEGANVVRRMEAYRKLRELTAALDQPQATTRHCNLLIELAYLGVKRRR